MPLEKPRTASMVFMDLLLKKYPTKFAWFSLRNSPNPVNDLYKIPYSYAAPLSFPSRFPWVKQFLNLILYSRVFGRKAAKFGRRQGSQLVLADLAFEAVVAGRVAARQLGVPLLVMVHDDPVNRLRVKGLPGWLIRLYAREFSRTLKAASGVAVISDYMGEYYRDQYQVGSVTLFPGVDPQKCLRPGKFSGDKKPFVIGSLGSVNSADNWNLLLEVVRLLNQKHGVGKFKILHIGQLPSHLPVSEDVEVTGWLPEKEFIENLARLDLGFLNWPFDPQYAVTTRTSLPLKITSYIQAQVPMLALGPEGSSVNRFVRDHECGSTITNSDVNVLADTIEKMVRLMSDTGSFKKGLESLKVLYNKEAFYDAFGKFVGRA